MDQCLGSEPKQAKLRRSASIIGVMQTDPSQPIGTTSLELLAQTMQAIDDQLSKRAIDLDEAGYLIIYLDLANQCIRAKHYTNVIDDRGLAVDPETGKPIPARGKVERLPTAEFAGRTAKEICVEFFEKTVPCPISRLDHAAYLGREFMRAEVALRTGQPYIQD